MRPSIVGGPHIIDTVYFTTSPSFCLQIRSVTPGLKFTSSTNAFLNIAHKLPYTFYRLRNDLRYSVLERSLTMAPLDTACIVRLSIVG